MTATAAATGRRFRPDLANKTLGIDGDKIVCKSMDFSDSDGWVRRRCRVVIADIEFSIIWGTGTYSDNHDATHIGEPMVEEPFTVEVMVGNLGDGKDDQDVRGWQSVTDVLAMFDAARALRTVAAKQVSA
jgi:hypothetical protein